MTSRFKPTKLHHIDFSTENVIKKQLLRRVSHIKTIDFQCVETEKHKSQIYRILKNVKHINKAAVSLNFKSSLKKVFALLHKKNGVKKIILNMPANPNTNVPLRDQNGVAWYPFHEHTRSSGLNANDHQNPFITHIFPKSLTSLFMHFSEASREMIVHLSKPVKRLKQLSTLGIEYNPPYNNMPKIEAELFNKMFNYKNKLQHLTFNGHLGGVSVTNVTHALRKSPIKSLSIYERFSKSWEFDLEKFRVLLQGHPQLESFSLTVLANESKNCANLIKLFAAQSIELKKFRLAIDPNFNIEAEDLLAIKEALSTMKNLEIVDVQYNQNYASNTTKEDDEVLMLDISPFKKLTELKVSLKGSREPRYSLKSFKTLCHDIFHFNKLQKLQLFIKTEIQETTLLYLLWSLKNMESLDDLTVKTVLPATEMAPLTELQKLPKFVNPSRLKKIALEWASNYEYFDKIFDFIGLQKHLEHLHIGIVRGNTTSSKDVSKMMVGLTSLNKLKSFHILSSSFVLFKAGCFDLYTQIVKKNSLLEKVGLTFMAQYAHNFSQFDILQVNNKAIELNNNVYEFIKQIGTKEMMKQVYLNFKIKMGAEENWKGLVDCLVGMKRLEMLSLYPEVIKKGEEAEPDYQAIKLIKKQILRMIQLKRFYLGVDKKLYANTKVQKTVTKIQSSLGRLERMALGADLHVVIG